MPTCLHSPISSAIFKQAPLTYSSRCRLLARLCLHELDAWPLVGFRTQAGNPLALLAFGLAALGCALSPSVGWLTAFRVMQGMSAGVGTVVGRAIIRDCFEGAAATRLLALVSMIFSLSPALAPVFGGWVVTLFTWRAIFLTLFAYAVAMLVLCVRSLPGNLAAAYTPTVRLGILAQQYVVGQSPLPSCWSCHRT